MVSGFMDGAMRDELAAIGPEAGRILDESPRGVSMVIGPTGEPVSEMLADHEGLLYAQVDIAACVEPKQFHDVAGSYNRFDVFRLSVDRSRNRPAVFDDGEGRLSPSPRVPEEEPRADPAGPR